MGASELTGTKGSYLVDDYLEVADFWAWETDDKLVLTYLSSGFTALTGLPASDFIGRARSQINTRHLDRRIWCAHRQILTRREPYRSFRYPLETRTGEVRWFESSGIPHHDADGRFVGYRGVARDVTDHVRDRDRLTASDRETRLQQTLLAQIERVSRIGAWRWTFGERHVSMSEEIYRILGTSPGKAMTPETAIRTFAPLSRAKFQKAVSRAVRRQAPFDVTVELQMPRRGKRWARAIGVPEVVDGRTARLFGTFQDVTEQREQELKMRHLAMTDALTGIANRTAFNDKLEQVVAACARTGERFLLCMADLNRFKQVNDQYGHDIGDQMLVRFTEQFAADMPDHWFFTRTGGDEFAVVIGNGADPIDLDADIDRLVGAVKREVEIGGFDVVVRATAGYVVAPTDGIDAQALLRRADLALYEAKREADSDIRCFKAEMDERFQRRVLLAKTFDDALYHGEIVPYYQPVVDLSSGRISGMEALARWNHPERGVLSAGAFVEVFDDARMSIQLTETMFEHVCCDMARWQAKGGRFGRIGINATASVLRQPGFALHVIETLSRYGLRPKNFIVEVTETTVINHSAPAIIDQLRHLLHAGVSVALDDFGTGFSSLVHLKSLPFNILKIDKSFIRDMSRSKADQSIVRALIHLGRDLGYTTVAEGIECQQEADLLRAIGCERGQGFLFRKPMPRSAVDQLLGVGSGEAVLAAVPGRRHQAGPGARRA